MPNNRFLLRVPIYFCFLILGLALGPTKTSAATACVWRVVDAKAPFYLVGTIHSLSGNDYPLPKPYNQALHDSKRLLFELSPDPRSNFGHYFVRAAIYPKGDTIAHHVRPATYQYLAKDFQMSNWATKGWRIGDYLFDTWDQMRPWAIAAMWGIHGYSDIYAQYGVDNHLGFQARRMGKETGGLESDLEHIEVLKGMADIDAELTLLDTMVRGDKRRDDYNRVRAAWKTGDLGPIAAEGERSRRLNLGGELRLLDFRNLRWMKRIEAEIASGEPTAIVVGTGHFVGPNNVRELLEKHGHKLEQL
jgi:uncharacterized protein YbaP (TraB family)